MVAGSSQVEIEKRERSGGLNFYVWSHVHRLFPLTIYAPLIVNSIE